MHYHTDGIRFLNVQMSERDMLPFHIHIYVNKYIQHSVSWAKNMQATSTAFNMPIGIMVRVFTSGPGDLGSIPDRIIPKTQKIVLHASLLNTQYYKV